MADLEFPTHISGQPIDPALLERLKKGEHKAFHDLYAIYQSASAPIVQQFRAELQRVGEAITALIDDEEKRRGKPRTAWTKEEETAVAAKAQKLEEEDEALKAIQQRYHSIFTSNGSPLWKANTNPNFYLTQLLERGAGQNGDGYGPAQLGLALEYARIADALKDKTEEATIKRRERLLEDAEGLLHEAAANPATDKPSVEAAKEAAVRLTHVAALERHTQLLRDAASSPTTPEGIARKKKAIEELGETPLSRIKALTESALQLRTTLPETATVARAAALDAIDTHNNLMRATLDRLQIGDDKKPTVLLLGGEFCPHCKTQAAEFERLKQVYGDKVNFQVVYGLDAQRTPTKDYPFFSAMTPGGSVPQLMMLDKDGRILSHEIGLQTGKTIQDNIALRLAVDTPAATIETEVGAPPRAIPMGPPPALKPAEGPRSEIMKAERRLTGDYIGAAAPAPDADKFAPVSPPNRPWLRGQRHIAALDFDNPLRQQIDPKNEKRTEANFIEAARRGHILGHNDKPISVDRAVGFVDTALRTRAADVIKATEADLAQLTKPENDGKRLQSRDGFGPGLTPSWSDDLPAKHDALRTANAIDAAAEIARNTVAAANLHPDLRTALSIAKHTYREGVDAALTLARELAKPESDRKVKPEQLLELQRRATDALGQAVAKESDQSPYMYNGVLTPREAATLAAAIARRDLTAGVHAEIERQHKAEEAKLQEIDTKLKAPAEIIKAYETELEHLATSDRNARPSPEATAAYDAAKKERDRLTAERDAQRIRAEKIGELRVTAATERDAAETAFTTLKAETDAKIEAAQAERAREEQRTQAREQALRDLESAVDPDQRMFDAEDIRKKAEAALAHHDVSDEDIGAHLINLTPEQLAEVKADAEKESKRREAVETIGNEPRPDLTALTRLAAITDVAIAEKKKAAEAAKAAEQHAAREQAIQTARKPLQDAVAAKAAPNTILQPADSEPIVDKAKAALAAGATPEHIREDLSPFSPGNLDEIARAAKAKREAIKPTGKTGEDNSYTPEERAQINQLRDIETAATEAARAASLRELGTAARNPSTPSSDTLMKAAETLERGVKEDEVRAQLAQVTAPKLDMMKKEAEGALAPLRGLAAEETDPVKRAAQKRRIADFERVARIAGELEPTRRAELEKARTALQTEVAKATGDTPAFDAAALAEKSRAAAALGAKPEEITADLLGQTALNGKGLNAEQLAAVKKAAEAIKAEDVVKATEAAITARAAEPAAPRGTERGIKVDDTPAAPTPTDPKAAALDTLKKQADRMKADPKLAEADAGRVVDAAVAARKAGVKPEEVSRAILDPKDGKKLTDRQLELIEKDAKGRAGANPKPADAPILEAVGTIARQERSQRFAERLQAAALLADEAKKPAGQFKPAEVVRLAEEAADKGVNADQIAGALKGAKLKPEQLKEVQDALKARKGQLVDPKASGYDAATANLTAVDTAVTDALTEARTREAARPAPPPETPAAASLRGLQAAIEAQKGKKGTEFKPGDIVESARTAIKAGLGYDEVARTMARSLDVDQLKKVKEVAATPPAGTNVATPEDQLVVAAADSAIKDAQLKAAEARSAKLEETVKALEERLTAIERRTPPARPTPETRRETPRDTGPARHPGDTPPRDTRPAPGRTGDTPPHARPAPGRREEERRPPAATAPAAGLTFESEAVKKGVSALFEKVHLLNNNKQGDDAKVIGEDGRHLSGDASRTLGHALIKKWRDAIKDRNVSAAELKAMEAEYDKLVAQGEKRDNTTTGRGSTATTEMEREIIKIREQIGGRVTPAPSPATRRRGPGTRADADPVPDRTPVAAAAPEKDKDTPATGRA